MDGDNLETNQSLEQLSEILLVMDKKRMKIQAVKGIGPNGDLETVNPTKNNHGQFMRVDKSGDIFSNFFSNFFKELKNPTQFLFFRVPALLGIDTAKELQKHIDNPSEEGEALFKKHEVKEPIQEHKKEKGMETTQSGAQDAQTNQTTTGEYRYKPEQIDWETMNNLGLNREKLEKKELLEPLLKGYKTNELLPISVNLGTAVFKTDARLSLQPGKDGMAVMVIHGVRKDPELHFPFFGHEFTKEDKDNLRNTGNMGRVVNLINPKTNDIIPSIISVDRLTNELVALRSNLIKIPDEYKGIKLNEEQKQTLLEGKALYLKGMISKNDKPFDGTIQFNADKRYLELPYYNNKQNLNKQEGQSMDAPRTFRGRELTDEQYQKYNNGQAVYFENLIDKKGQPYSGYATFNKEIGKEDFSFGNQSKMKEKIQPMEGNKVQVEVNSNGKTNEATKNIKEPLKAEQNQPLSQKQKEQQDKKPAKKGRRVS